MEKKKKILYSAVVLTEKSRSKLLNIIGHMIPDDWTKYVHHMTIAFGEGLPKELDKYKNKQVELVVSDFGESEFAMAVKVKGFFSKNDVPHITLAVNPNVGGRPVHSNDITDWKNINSVVGKKQITLQGVVEEITT